MPPRADQHHGHAQESWSTDWDAELRALVYGWCSPCQTYHRFVNECPYDEYTEAELNAFGREYRELLHDAYVHGETTLLQRGEHPFFAHCAVCSLRIDTRDTMVMITWDASPLWYRGYVYTHETCYRKEVPTWEPKR